MQVNCAFLNREHETEFSSDLLHMFSPHPTTTEVEQKKTSSLSGWEICPHLHDEDSPFQCVNNHPYFALQLVQMSLSDVDDFNTAHSRPTCGNEDNKRRNRIPNTLNLTIRRSKSSRCLQTNTVASFPRGAYNSPFRHDSKFPTLFHGLREIIYEFQSTADHKQHVDAYRNSYTAILIRNFRELHQATVSVGERCQKGTRLCVSDGSSSTSQQRNRSETSRRKVPPSPPQCPVFYSDQCQTGPIAILSGTNLSTKKADFSSSTCAGLCYLPKSTMEINTVNLRSSQHQPNGEHSSKLKTPQGENAKAIAASRQQSGDLLFLKRKGQDHHNRVFIASRSGSSTVRNVTSPPFRRRTSPFGKIPVRVRRSSPSIRGKRDPLHGSQGVNRFLSIAVATHTVASPFRSDASHSEEDLSRLHSNV